MTRFALVFALLVSSVPVAAQNQPLSLEHRMLLRCAATMALVANGQETGNPRMADYPDMRESGREFFIRASVQVMDEAQLSREEVEAHLRAEARDITTKSTLHDMVPVCLPLLLQPQ